jgi:hypothetical protein
MFGTVETDMPAAAVVWLLGTPECTKHPMLFMKTSSAVLEDMLDVYPVLYNCVSVENIVHVRWLEWMGAEFDYSELNEYGGLTFVPFSIRKEITNVH